MIKIGVLSDTHIPERAQSLPAEMLKAFKGVDMIIHAGDVTDPEIIEKLKGICPQVYAVSGNMDPDCLAKNYPAKQVISAGKYRIGLMHGLGHPAKLIELLEKSFRAQKVDIIIFGHSHTPYNEKKDGVLYFNPGSPTDKIFSPYNSYGIIELDDTIQAKIIRIS